MYEYEEVRIKMDLIQKNLLEQVAGLHEIPEGAYNIRREKNQPACYIRPI